MEETLISFETAKLAKEVNIDLKQLPTTTGKNWYTRSGTLNGYTPKEPYYTTSQSILQKILRDTCNIIIGISLDTLFKRDTYCIFIYEKVEDLTISRPLTNELFSGYNTYEEALEVGLQEALKLIKN